MSFLNRVHWSLVGLALVSAAVLTAQSGAPQVSGDWPMYSHSLSGQRYSPLTDISADNVARLAPAWSLRLTQPAGRRGGGPPPASPVVGAPARGTPPAATRYSRSMPTPGRKCGGGSCLATSPRLREVWPSGPATARPAPASW